MKNIMIISKLGKSYSGGPWPCSGKFGSVSICEILEKNVFSSSALSMGWISILPSCDLIEGGGELNDFNLLTDFAMRHHFPGGMD